MTDAIKAFESKNEDKLANAIIEALNGVFSAVLTADTVKKIEKKHRHSHRSYSREQNLARRLKACCGPSMEQKWTLVSEEDANGKGTKKREKGAKGAVTLIMERLCSRLIRRLGEGIAHSLITQGSYGSPQSIAMRRWKSARSKLQALRVTGEKGKLLALGPNCSRRPLPQQPLPQNLWDRMGHLHPRQHVLIDKEHKSLGPPAVLQRGWIRR